MIIGFENVWIMIYVVPLLLLLIWIISKDFVKVDKRFSDEESFLHNRRKNRVWLLFSRSVILILIFLALAGPFIESETFEDTDPKITLLIDNSTSMELIDTDFINQFVENLKNEVPVTVREFGGEDSPLGDEVLGELQEGENILIITDGYAHAGATLSTAASFGRTINSTINAITIEPSVDEVAVRIEGPSKAVATVNNTYHVIISKTFPQEVNLRVSVDDDLVYDDVYSGEVFSFLKTFNEGSHVITAMVTKEDKFIQNNRYIHTVNVIEKPKVLLLSTKNSGITKILDNLYETDTRTSMPDNLDEYYAVIINDLPARGINNQELLIDYLNEGNGLFVIGGPSSFDNGQYKNTVLETILPVRIGAGTRRPGDANIAVAIDLSGSTGVKYKKEGDKFVEIDSGTQDLEKALAASVISELHPANTVGVLGFTYKLPERIEKTCSGACVIWETSQLGKNKQNIIDNIAAIDITGGTSLSTGMSGALGMLRGFPGSKNIVFVSDGISNADDKTLALEVAKEVAAQGGRVYSVHVGESDDSFMEELANAGNGIFFEASHTNRLAVLFGDPVDIEQGNAFDLFALNSHHFITRDLQLDGTLYGYNQVAPKLGSQTLVVSNGGDPILNVWNYGVGKVATLTAFNGQDLGILLNNKNSKLLTRSINWLIGDPERKQTYVVSIPDGRLDKSIPVTIRTEQLPSSAELIFEPIGKDTYRTTVSHDEMGSYELLQTKYAVNYPLELSKVGFNKRMADELAISGGLVFDPSDTQAIVDHVKTLQQLKRIDKQQLFWYAVSLALLIYFLEVLVRRIRERNRGRR